MSAWARRCPFRCPDFLPRAQATALSLVAQACGGCSLVGTYYERILAPIERHADVRCHDEDMLQYKCVLSPVASHCFYMYARHLRYALERVRVRKISSVLCFVLSYMCDVCVCVKVRVYMLYYAYMYIYGI